MSEAARAGTAESASAWRMLALGDSYTIGESVTAAESWPMQLAALLRARGMSVGEPRIVARTGWTTDELSAALDLVEAELTPPYALVSLLIGVNNQYRGRTVEEYGEQFATLLQRANRWAGTRGELRVLSIPDWGVTPFASKDTRSKEQIGQQIDAYNECARSICERLGVHFIDITMASREAAERPELLCADELHPSALEYARWADRVSQSLNLTESTGPARIVSPVR